MQNAFNKSPSGGFPKLQPPALDDEITKLLDEK